MSKEELLMKSLGEAIQRARKERKITQEELGKMTGTSPMTIKRLESSAVGTRLDNVVAVATALGIQLSSIFREIEGTDTPIPKKKAPNRLDAIVAEIESLTAIEREWIVDLLETTLRSPWRSKN